MTTEVSAKGASFREMRAASAFVFREYHMKRRNLSWTAVWLLYSFVNCVSIALIGVSLGSEAKTLDLLIGAFIWTYLFVLFFEISNSIAFERWEGTIEYTFMAPISRVTHLVGVSLFAALYSLGRVLVIGVALLLFVRVDLGGANAVGLIATLLLATVSFVGMGIMAAVLPLMNPENGAQATNVVIAVLLLVSGVYYPIETLPVWVRPLAWFSPATYALRAERKFAGLAPDGGSVGPGASFVDVLPELGALALLGLLLVPLGLLLFASAERYAKRTGRLKTNG